MEKVVSVGLILLSIITCRTTPTEVPASSHLSSFFLNNETLAEGGSMTSDSTSTGPTKSKIVETKYGRLQGLSLALFPFLSGKSSSTLAGPIKNKVVEVFLGIPYASVPIRFTPTQTPIPWEGVRLADKPGPACPQMFPDVRSDTESLKEMPRGYLEYLRRLEPFLRNQAEDCLYLNIYSPIGGGPDPKLKPVIVFIHSGKFAWGSGNLVDGTVLAGYGDVVFITFNYRLGVLGFLNLNMTPGRKAEVSNYGLLDQIAAVHWIKENIIFFGGDPENITLMGYEAGAASIHFLMSSPAVMPGLFHRAVLIGASGFAPWAVVADPLGAATLLAQNLNCSGPPAMAVNSTSPGGNVTGQAPQPLPVSSYHPGKSSHQHPILECLKSKHFSHFSNFAPNKFSVEFGPTVDGIVIKPYTKTKPDSMGKRDLVKTYDLLFGLSSLEKMIEFSEADLTFGFEGQRRDAILRTVIRNSYRFHLNEILATVINEYTDWERSVQHPIATRDLTLNAVTDCLALAPVIGASESSQINKAFFYVFDHATRDGLYNYQRSGAAGGEELSYMLGSPLIELMTGQVLPFVPNPLPANFTKSEMALAELMITFISNFAASSDPNEPVKPDQTWPLSKERNRFRNSPWEQYDRVQQKYLEITGGKIKMKSHYRSHQMAIWLRLIPELQRTGAHYASSLHNRLKAGNDPAFYVGSIRNPLVGEEDILNPQLFDLVFDPTGGGGTELEDSDGNPPSPPTTCFSPVFSAKNSTAQGFPGLGSKDKYDTNATVFEVSNIFAPYSTALSVTIAIGCALLILNVFIFALVYYQRDKRRAQLLKNSQSSELESREKYSEPPELLKSNAPRGGVNSISACSQTGSESYGIQSCGTGPAVTSTSAVQHHRGILLSPQQTHAHMNHQASGHQYSSASQLLGVGTLPRANNNGGIGLSLSTLPKPPPPPRSVSNFSTLPHKGHVCPSQIPGSSSCQKLMPFEELNV